MATAGRVLPWRRKPQQAVEETSLLLTAFLEHHPDTDADLIERAYQVALRAHEGQIRKSGEPYINHPLSVATIVARQGLDDITVAAALLHDAVEDTLIDLGDLERDFGTDVARIVDGVTKLDRLTFESREEQQAASMRKMLVALAKDLRVLIIKLADRLHNMRTVAALPESKQQRVARETLDIYAPLAHRLGMQEVKVQLEDLALATLHPKRYSQIDQMVQDRAPERDLYLDQVVGEVNQRLQGF
ncbi:MAG TPA: HD domain-containing protein, partial [Acidimicrobiales bacterium]|nr:HD domain-containing protein [Acidimicrobiales bacterium]